MDCLFTDEETKDKSVAELKKEAVLVHGVANDFGFVSERVEKHRDEIASMLQDLPDEFHQKKGGGMSFLQACMDKDGNLWGEHRSIEQLVTLGIAIGQVKYCLPREMWSALPGGVPYLVVIE